MDFWGSCYQVYGEALHLHMKMGHQSFKWVRTYGLQSETEDHLHKLLIRLVTYLKGSLTNCTPLFEAFY